jgi:hypothetical protein
MVAERYSGSVRGVVDRVLARRDNRRESGARSRERLASDRDHGNNDE